MKIEKDRPGFMVYFCDWDIPRKLLEPEAFTAFFNMVFDYAQDGVLPEQYPDKQVQVFFESYRVKIEKDLERYQEVCRKRSEAGKKAHEKKQMEANAANCSPVPESTTIPYSNQYQEQYPRPYQHHKQQQNPYAGQQMPEELPF